MSDADVETVKVIEYRSALQACVLAREILRQHDIAGLLRAIETAHTTGPILDPTLYRDKVGAMEENAALFRAALKLRDFDPKAEARRG